MMGEIYTLAKTTLSWLGEAADQSDVAMALIQTLGDWTREHEGEIFDGEGEDMPDDGSVQTMTAAIEWLGFPLSAQNWPAVWRFLERPYWSRVWVIQELAVRGGIRKASGVFVCGEDEFERPQFDYFCVLILFILLYGQSIRASSLEIEEPHRSMLINGHPPGLTMSQVVTACTGGSNRNLDWLLRTSARFQATDPRDKLYALLGLVEDGNIITPDYSKSYEEVVRMFVASHIEKYSSLRVLLGNRYRAIPSSPSWVPDLLSQEFHGGSGLIPAIGNDRFQASGSRLAVASLNVTLSSLFCRGVSIDIIDKAIGPLLMVEKQLDSAVQDLQTAAQSVGQNTFFDALIDFYRTLAPGSGEAFWRTLCLDGDWSGIDTVFPAPAIFELQMRVAFGMDRIPADFMAGTPENTRYIEFVGPFTRSLMIALSNRTFFTLKDGRMGVGPYLAQPGDLVVVLFGAVFCLVLRPVGDNRYRLVGDAYVHGAMSGELVGGTNDQEDGQVFELI
ncbi:hypothetical protein B0H63DRAFT_402292 [Podospora didyma]|uniref:Heterokaryon incompatibility domain-containing protein n=1 Tax=Podospora didyma TaxID=330526 RepID=A0AAE0K4L3_9PEZI|nr:hypothetical protein B0H63DRAFT_402292 [Podospora didyma]